MPSSPTTGSGPTLSVVVASLRARPVLETCLARLRPPCVRAGAELIVARPPERGDLDAIAASHPGLRVVAAPAGADLPRVRGTGLAAAGGRLVALIEDHCLPAAGWVAQLRTHVGGTADVVGGAMENGQRSRAVDWGAYFAEYGIYARSRAVAGTRAALTDGNVAYHRRVVGRVAAWALDGAWENVVHARLVAAGATLRFDPELVVAQGLSHAVPAFCRDRYQHGRDFARARLAEERATGAVRWLRAVTAPALPPLLAWRIARRAEQRSAFAAALPFTLTFLAAWSLGEAAGYVRGAGR